MADEIESRDSDWLTDIAAGELAGAELRAALAARVGNDEEVERAAAEIEVARRVRALMLSLREADVEVPEDFEARLMERVSGDQTMLEMMELSLSGFGGVFVELINAMFSFLTPPPQTQLRTT